MRATRKAITVAIAATALLLLVAAGPLMSRVEQPNYTVERAEDAIELRDYPPLIVAEVTVPGDRETAVQRGFRLIAGYIFGDNEGARRVAMTAPVMQQSAPVGADKSAGNRWIVRFVMPKSWALNALPRPKDARIATKELPATTMAVIRFSGLARDPAVRAETEKLTTFIAARHLVATEAPILAFYNPPWTLPLMRRNEIMIPVRNP